MISISSLMGGSSSSGSISNMNAITGLASGLDTEAMIEGMVQSYQQKIVSLRQDSTKLTWQQEAYQSISDKLVNFATKYTSYTSDTNIFSSGFFTNSVTNNVLGEFADKISATGKTDSKVVINSVSSLAEKAEYIAGSGSILGTAGTFTSEDLSKQYTIGDTTGSLSFTLGEGEDAKTYSVSFGADEHELIKDASGNIDTDKLKEAIAKKLSESYEDEFGSLTANDIALTSDDNGMTLSVDGKAATITGGSGIITSEEIEGSDGEKTVTYKVGTASGANIGSVSALLSGSKFTVTLNGESHEITLGTVAGNTGDDIADAMNEALKGIGGGRITVDYNDGKFTLTAGAGDTVSIAAGNKDIGNILFGGDNTSVTNKVDTSKTLGELGIDVGDGKFTINGKTIDVTADTTIADLMKTINEDTEIGVTVSYSQSSNTFMFTSDKTGADAKIEFTDTLGLFGTAGTSVTETGTNAKLIATVNGQTMEMERSSNNIDIDGMTVKLEGTFNESATVDTASQYEGASFTSEVDTETIINGIKAMVEDFNTMIKEIKDAYTTAPLKQTNGSKYEPLTEDEEAELTDTEIEKYNEKAQTGLLYMDSTLSSLYDELRSAVIPGGVDGTFLQSIGIETKYEDGLTTLVVDEEKLQQALETNLDGVKDAFTKSEEDGSTSNGIMAALQEVTDKYAKTSGADKGILIEMAGSQFSSSSLIENDIQKQMEDIDEDIEKWQDKLSNKVDFYTRQFTQLELLINQMNSQSSTLAGLTGGY